MSDEKPLSVTAEPAALPPFNDPRVQMVYHIICEDATPDDLREHWEGFMARKIVAALAKPTAPINVAAQEPGAIGAPVASSTSPVAATPNEPTAEGAPALRDPPDCQMCKGSGEIRSMTNHLGPDDYEFDDMCPACWGTGSADPADAVNALGYWNHMGKTVVHRSDVLRLFKARAALASVHPVPAPYAFDCQWDALMNVGEPCNSELRYADDIPSTWDDPPDRMVPLYAHPVAPAPSADA